MNDNTFLCILKNPKNRATVKRPRMALESLADFHMIDFTSEPPKELLGLSLAGRSKR